MSIIKLKNPKTEHYNKCKKNILNSEFTWNHYKEFVPKRNNNKKLLTSNLELIENKHDEFSIYTHVFLHRPTKHT